LEILRKYILGIPRREGGLENPEVTKDASNYASRILQLHSLYGKKSTTYSELTQLIANYKPAGTQRVDYTEFLANLSIYVQRLVSIGSNSEAAYELGNGRIKHCMPETIRRYMVDKLENRHNEYTTEQVKFYDYKDWLAGYFADMHQEFIDTSKEEDTKDSKSSKSKDSKDSKETKDSKNSKNSKKLKKSFYNYKEWKTGGDNNKKNRNDDKNSFFNKKTVLMICKLHGKPVTHTSVECRLPDEIKKKVCRENKLCFVCQNEGHPQDKCRNKKVVALLAAIQETGTFSENKGGKRNYKGGNKGKNKNRNKSQTKDQQPQQKPEEIQVKKEVKANPFTPNTESKNKQ